MGRRAGQLVYGRSDRAFIIPVLAWIGVYRSKAPICQATDVRTCAVLLLRRDQSFTAVRTAALWGETTSSSPTSPRVGKPPGGGTFGGGGGNTNSPLLKAALNANLARINAVQQQQQVLLSASGAAVSKAGPGSLHGLTTGMMSASGALTGGVNSSSEQPGISSKVKQRLKEYFVARNTDLLPAGAAAAGGHHGAAGGGFASSDTGYSGGRQQPSPMQH